MKRRPEHGPEGGSPGDGVPGSAWKRIGWFVLLWGGGVLAVTVVSYAIRMAIL